MTVADQKTPLADEGLTPRCCRFAFVVAACALLSLAFRPLDLLVDKPMTEDGYYMLSVARHLAMGDGLSTDGVRQTNGVQPLFTLLAALLYLPVEGDRVLGLRLVLLLHSMIFVLAANLFGRVLRDAVQDINGHPRELLRWFGSLAYLASGYYFLQHHNGLETGLLLLGYLCCWRMHQVWPIDSVSRAAMHGAALGLLVLARIDATFLVAALAALHVWRSAPTQRRARLDQALAVVLGAVIVSSPWWLYNLIGFGSLMPTSGQAQTLGIAQHATLDHWLFRLYESITSVLLMGTPQFYVGAGPGPWWAIGVRMVMLALLVRLSWRPLRDLLRAGRSRHATVDRTGSTFALALLAAGTALAVYYTARFWAAHFYPRYFVPLSLFGTAIFALGAVQLATRRTPLRPLIPAGLAAAAVGLVVISNTGAVFAGSVWNREQRTLVQEHVPATELVAAGQSGTLGYFVDRVLNLDGKVNLEALPHQTDMRDYLLANDVQWICDWPSYLQRYLGDSLADEWRLVATRGEFELWRRR